MTCNNITGVLGPYLPQTKCLNLVWGRDKETQESFAARNRIFTFTEFWVQDWSRLQVFLHVGLFSSLSLWHQRSQWIVKTLQCFQSSQFKFAIIGKGLKHPLVDALPNSTAIFHHRSMATPGILTTTKTLGERMGKYKLVLRGFCSSAKLKVLAKPQWIGRQV